MENLNKRLLKSKLFLTLLILPVFQPILFYKFTLLTYFFAFLMVCSFLTLFIMIVAERIPIDKIHLIIIISLMLVIFPTIFNRGDVLKISYFSMSVLSLYWLFTLAAKHSTINRVISIISNLLFLYLSINIVGYILFPSGIAEDSLFLLGFRTRFTEVAIASIVLSYIVYAKDKNIIRWFISLFVALSNLILPWIVTGLILIMLIWALYIIFKIFKNDKPFFIIVSLILILMPILIVTTNVIEIIGPILSFFGKDATLTGRTEVWALGIVEIKNTLLIGRGLTLNNGSFIFWNNQYIQAHNQMLQSIYEGGGLSWLLLIYLMIHSSYLTYKHKSKTNVLITSTIFAYYIGMISESYAGYIYFYLIIFLALFSRQINVKRKESPYDLL